MSEHFSEAVWHPLPKAFRVRAAQVPSSVLLETAKPSETSDRSFLFFAPSTELVAWNAEELERVLEEVDCHVAAGSFVAGYFHYECGEAFVGLTPETPHRNPENGPIAWLGVFDNIIEFHHRDGTTHGGSLPDVHTADDIASAKLVSDGLQISRADYHDRIKRVQEYLEAGHTYQVNFTDRIRGYIEASPMAVYEMLLKQQPVSFAAYVHHGEETLLSFSPEMFYRTSEGKVTVRPMKGTWPRGVNIEQDLEAEKQFLHDEKNRGEHVTIVDLLRNDVGRISKPGSVVVEKLFSVERYNTLLQMTSTISGSLQEQLSPSQIFRSLFPSGSITGAPKRRTMEIIRELESQPRGIYTGSIGYFAPGGEACFNVAIRTMALKDSTFTLGVGGGITADSKADEEYEECHLKGAFLTRERPPFALLETMRCDAGIPLLDLHLKRLESSAAYFGIAYDHVALRTDLSRIVAECGSVSSRIRLTLDENGAWKISVSTLDTPPWRGRVLLADTPTDSHDIFLYHKTTHREFYDGHLATAKTAGFDEVLFRNESSHLTECAISSIFLFIKGGWVTPSLSCGVLPGVQRSVQIQSLHPVIEIELSLHDLQHVERFVVCNAVRGIRRVYEVWNSENEVVWRDPSVSRDNYDRVDPIL